MKDKKIMTISLLIFAVVIITGSYFVFNSLNIEKVQITPEEEIEIQQMRKLKNVAVNNIQSFLKTSLFNKYYPDSVLEDLYNNQQYIDLQEVEVIINIEDNVGNPKPFTP